VDAETSDEMLPVLWEDNYVSLPPPESRALVARYNSPIGARPLRPEVNGWNIEPPAAPVPDAGVEARGGRQSPRLRRR